MYKASTIYQHTTERTRENRECAKYVLRALITADALSIPKTVAAEESKLSCPNLTNLYRNNTDQSLIFNRKTPFIEL